jgi:hypothetical protein
MKIAREFCPGDRYLYDFGLCSYEMGRAQLDTAQDASFQTDPLLATNPFGATKNAGCGLPKCTSYLTGNVRAVGYWWGHDTRYTKS